MQSTPPDSVSSETTEDGASSAAGLRKPLIDSVDITDPSERKRVLNVLAQRRYRRRKRDQQAKLEGLVRAIQHGDDDATLQRSNRSKQKSSVDDTRSLQIIESASPDQADDSFIFDATDVNSESQPIHAEETSLGRDPTIFTTLDVSLSEDWSNSLEYSDPDLSAFSVQLGEFLQDEQTQSQSFPDDRLVNVPELGVLRAALTIATRINSTDRLWDAGAESIYHAGSSQGWVEFLPKNLRPTAAQLLIPHHPILDILPWPSMRVRLINMYSMPPDMWPRDPHDKSELNLFRLVCDIESGGVRVWGEDPTTEDSWEMAQGFVETWWWALDERIVTLSNKRRAARGEPRLAIGLLTNGSATS